MSNTAKNLIVILMVLTVAFAGYFFLSQETLLVLRSPESNRQLEKMLIRTQEFVGHRQVLDSITLDSSILQTNQFQNLRSFSPTPQEFSVGRTNPFVATGPEEPLSQPEAASDESLILDQ